MTRARRVLAVAVCLAGVGGAPASHCAAPLHETVLRIESEDAKHGFRVEVAITPSAQARGLMWRRVLAPDAGMLFVFVPPREASFYMKNTLIPLDMIFIAPDGHIHKIVTRDDTRSTATTSSNGTMQAVLEIVGGRAAELGIKVGDRVFHPLLKPR